MADLQASKQAAGGALQSILASTAGSTGAGFSFDLNGAYNTFSVQCITTSTAISVELEGSLNDSDWDTLGSTALYASTAGVIVAVSNTKPVAFVRLNTVSIASTGKSLAGYIGFA